MDSLVRGDENIILTEKWLRVFSRIKERNPISLNIKKVVYKNESYK